MAHKPMKIIHSESLDRILAMYGVHLFTRLIHVLAELLFMLVVSQWVKQQFLPSWCYLVRVAMPAQRKMALQRAPMVIGQRVTLLSNFSNRYLVIEKSNSFLLWLQRSHSDLMKYSCSFYNQYQLTTSSTFVCFEFQKKYISIVINESAFIDRMNSSKSNYTQHPTVTSHAWNKDEDHIVLRSELMKRRSRIDWYGYVIQAFYNRVESNFLWLLAVHLITHRKYINCFAPSTWQSERSQFVVEADLASNEIVKKNGCFVSETTIDDL